jgi:hypothetical protein
MSEPLVLCVMLTADRPEMARKAVGCYRSQTYANKRLYIYDSGLNPCINSLPDNFPDFGIVYHRTHGGRTIGALRNEANAWGCSGEGVIRPDILAHFDDDDYSHPRRIAEQVACLRVSAADAVGYNQMLFWDETVGEAWLYRHPDPSYCLGTSLMYWRETWERKAFEPSSRGEDRTFINGLMTVGHGSLLIAVKPRMIARIHSANTCARIDPSVPDQWQRVSELDEECRKAMQL